MFCVSSGASAYDFEADGIYYNIMSEAGKTVEVTSGENKYFGDVSIPVTVENGGDDIHRNKDRRRCFLRV